MKTIKIITAVLSLVALVTGIVGVIIMCTDKKY